MQAPFVIAGTHIDKSYDHQSINYVEESVVTFHHKSGIEKLVIKRDGLWRNAILYRQNDPKKTVICRGMKEIFAYFQETYPDVNPFIMLPLHDGYAALYGPDGYPTHRIMKSGDRYTVRQFNPHYSKTFVNLTNAILHVICLTAGKDND